MTSVFLFPRIFGDEKKAVPWFDGYTRVTSRFWGHLYFRHTRKAAAHGWGPVQTGVGVPRALDFRVGFQKGRLALGASLRRLRRSLSGSHVVAKPAELIPTHR